MSKKIYKYHATPTTLLPLGAEIIKFGIQSGNPMIWAIVDTDAPLEPRCFNVYGTGIDLPEDHGRHRGTAMYGDIVWHCFEGKIKVN